MSALSERRLISFLEARFHEVAPGVGLGIGDDAAVLRAGGAEPWVVSVDASVEGVHFDLAYLDYADIGYRSFQAAASDLAAMGATPAGALSALILPKTMSADAIDALTAGQAAASREAGCPVIGGNVSRGRELSVTTTVLGRAQRPLTRAGARPGEQLWLVGELGLAAAGLAALRTGRRPAVDEDERPAGTEARRCIATGACSPALARCVAAWRRPRAQLEFGRELVGRASATIDVSDGLAGDVGQLATASGVRIVIDREWLRASLHADLLGGARELGRSALRFALAGGEDYALLATGPSVLRPVGARRIGYVTRGRGAFLRRGGRLIPLGAGFDHLRA